MYCSRPYRYCELWVSSAPSSLSSQSGDGGGGGFFLGCMDFGRMLDNSTNYYLLFFFFFSGYMLAHARAHTHTHTRTHTHTHALSPSLFPHWDTADAEIKIPSVEKLELSKILPFKPGICQNRANHVSPTARNFVLISFFKVHSSLLFQSLSTFSLH